MQTTPGNKFGERGLTLFELLIVLAILAAMASVAGAGYRNASPRLALNSASSQLVTDMKAARLHARQTGGAVLIHPTDKGYEIPALGVSRNFPQNLMASWRTDASTLVFSERFTALGASVKLELKSRQTTIRIHPITGKISRS